MTFWSFTGSSTEQPYVQPQRNTNPPVIRGSTTTPDDVVHIGATLVTRSPSDTAASQVYRVTVPPGVNPGTEFTVQAGNRRVRVVCPASSRPGQSLQITLPPASVTTRHHLKAVPLTRACEPGEYAITVQAYNRDDGGDGGAELMSKEVHRSNNQGSKGGVNFHHVTIPANTPPGGKFTATVDGQCFSVTCPPNARPGTKVRIQAAPRERQPALQEPEAESKMQVFEVIVPNGVRPNQPFTLMAQGQRVLVTCPPNVYPGSKIRFQLPVPTDTGKSKPKPNTRLAYKDGSGSSGWERTIRVQDMQFQWIRMSDDSKKGDTQVVDVESMEAFDFGKAAYVRKIHYQEGNHPSMRTGTVSLVPAQEAVVDSKYVRNDNNQKKILLSYTDIEDVQTKCLDKKVDWFRDHVCKELFMPMDQGHVKIVVRRDSLLKDSMDAVMSLGREDMHKRWRYEFAGEPGIEAGGLTREWFQLVTEQLFDPDLGLWLPSVNNQMSMRINPASNISCPDDYLIFFRFLGRVVGRALFDGQLIKGHMARYMYKHLLGWPITFEDLQAQDEEYYSSLKQLTKMKDLSPMYLDFTVVEELLGEKKQINLVDAGIMKDVTAENLPEYLEANLKYKMLNRCKLQITELMLGFFDIIPEPALTVFDPNELELILCGLPTIDMDDWTNNSKYTGYFEAQGRHHKVVEWFWEVVRDDFDTEMKARLLQFVTGTSGVPPRGFSVLQGNDGNIKKFCVHGVSLDQYVYPRAHTCFNRIDLPNYSSKEELRQRVTQAVSMTYVGFDME